MSKRKLNFAVFIAVVMLLSCIPGQIAMAQDAASTGHVVNCVNAVNVRSGPGTSYAIVGAAPKNAVYSILGQTGAWYKISFNGGTGYISASYFSVDSAVMAAQTASGSIGTIVNCTNGVNVRSGPGTGYSILGTAPKSAVYSVLGTSGSWVKISFGAKTGYVSSSYIKVSAGSATAPAPSSQTATIVNCTSGVNVRSGPGTKYAIIGSAPKGMTYPLKGQSGSYYIITFGGRDGYVHQSYVLVKSAPTPTPIPAPSEDADKLIVGYYASWAAYSGYTPASIPEQVTHVTYAFANIGADLKIAMGDPTIDPANFEKLKTLKQQRPDLKTLISIGGWSWSDKFSDAALTDASRTAFADSVVAFVKQYGFDGVDIDWEYPVGGGLSGNTARPADKANFTLLMAKLREKLDALGAQDARHYLLAFAGASGTFYTENTELSKLAGYVDFATVMTYDMHGAWPNSYTDFNAPLYTPSENTPQYKWSCNAAVKLWTDKGFPKTKIVMGIPFYGIKFNSVTNTGRGLYQPFASGSSIPYDKIVSTYLSNPAYTRYEHLDALVPWLFNGSTFISYDDARSVAAKAAYIDDTGLGGAAIWELSQNADGTLVGVINQNMQ